MGPASYRVLALLLLGIASSALVLTGIVEDMGDVCLKVAEVLAHDLVYRRVVDLPVQAHDTVAETDHLSQRGQESFRHDTGLA